MQLMNVEGVQLRGAVLDDPVLHVTLVHDDVGLGIGRIECRGRVPLDGDVEGGGTVGVLGILELL